MSSAVTVVCPSCEAVLKVTKPSLVGKKVACPSCRKPVLIEAPKSVAIAPADDVIPLQEDGWERSESQPRTPSKGAPKTAVGAKGKAGGKSQSRGGGDSQSSSVSPSKSSRKGD